MEKHLIAVALLILAVPCSAELKDGSAAAAALKSNVPKERLEAIQYLAAQRSDPASEALSAHFVLEADAYLRVQLLESLDVNSSTWAYVCAEQGAADVNQAVRQAAAAAIAQRGGDPAADKKLAALAADPSEAVRLSVVNSLSFRPGPSSAAIIGGVLADQKGPVKVRRAAARALSGMRTAEADAELEKHLADGDSEVKAAAVSRRPPKAKQQQQKKKKNR